LQTQDEGASPTAYGKVVEVSEELQEIRVPITVFASVRACDFGDAAYIAIGAIRRALKTCSIESDHPARLTTHVEINGEWINVHIHKLMETGCAAGNGYLWTETSAKAYRESS
jgi:hypothetical protein